MAIRPHTIKKTNVNKMHNDGPLTIAVGMNAYSKSWKNNNVQWGELVEKFKEPIRTAETMEQYARASKLDRGRIKDVGGYVGGYIRGGRRKPENVVHRQLLTLDLDFATNDVWDMVALLLPYAAVLHSTHSHTEKTPKFRLIMPISRTCSAEEYEALGRRIAGDIGIDLFDPTTFQVERLMFWPSCSSDAEYVVEAQDAPWVDVDEVLARYIDWRDMSLWPTSEASKEHTREHVGKLEDPLTKRGIVGAFCRTYDIHAAMDSFLQGEYAPVNNDRERYTYLKGSTAGGVVIYEDKFAYSHHGTDPISGQGVNAFDLVRINKFGHLDSGKTGGTKLPSYKAMVSLAEDDPNVRRTLASEAVQSIDFDFPEGYEAAPAAPDDDEEVADDSWLDKLKMKSEGIAYPTASNISLLLANEPNLKGLFKYNTFDAKRYMMRSAPWRPIDEPKPVRNVDYSGLRSYLESGYGISNQSKIADALAVQVERDSFHPIRDYLNGLSWDGRPRLDNALIHYFGAVDNVYTREAMRKMLCGAVARVFEPGIKFDLVLVLVSSEGQGKSTFIDKLGGPWFSDSFMTVHGKEAFEQLQGAWLIEMAELSAMRKADIEAVKHFITKKVDSFRPAYGHTSEDFPRQCVFFATTNTRSFLKDPVGNRRFMPVDVRPDKVTKSVFTMTQAEIDQIWAEAVERYRQGEKLYLSKEAEKLAAVERRGHSEVDDREGIVVDYLEQLLPENWAKLDRYERRAFLSDPEQTGTVVRTCVSAAELWAECFGNEPKDMDGYKMRPINAIMRGIPGWELSAKPKVIRPYGMQRYYVKTEQ